MKPWFTEIGGPRINIGQCATIISEADQRTRIGVWGETFDDGQITIGDYVMISPGCRISSGHSITIGHSVMMANGVYIADSDWHGVYDRTSRPKGHTPIDIHDNVWLGDGVTVLKGVTIGKNSVIGANSTVTKDIPANVIAAGSPARVVKELDMSRPMKIRADYFADPVALAKYYDNIEREILSPNGFFNYLRALVFPNRND
jgi:acetyltransferase-like isoleucine patch superfamily enzyme